MQIWNTKKKNDGNIILLYLIYKFLYILIILLISKQNMILSEFNLFDLCYYYFYACFVLLVAGYFWEFGKILMQRKLKEKMHLLNNPNI